MPFKQGRSPSVVVEKGDHRSFRGDLLAQGYKPHTGLRTRREGEIQAWIKPIGRGRQVHVQEVRRRNGSVAIFAHTEPEGGTVAHAVAAILDQASFSGGAKVLRTDLRERGWEF